MVLFFLTLSAFDAALAATCFMQGLMLDAGVLVVASAFAGLTAYLAANRMEK